MKNPFIPLPIESLDDVSFLALAQEQQAVFTAIDFPLDVFFSTCLFTLQNQIQEFENALQTWSQIEDQYSLAVFGELERALLFLLHKIKYHQYSSDEDQKKAYYHLGRFLSSTHFFLKFKKKITFYFIIHFKLCFQCLH